MHKYAAAGCDGIADKAAGLREQRDEGPAGQVRDVVLEVDQILHTQPTTPTSQGEPLLVSGVADNWKKEHKRPRTSA